VGLTTVGYEYDATFYDVILCRTQQHGPAGAWTKTSSMDSDASQSASAETAQNDTSTSCDIDTRQLNASNSELPVS